MDVFKIKKTLKNRTKTFLIYHMTNSNKVGLLNEKNAAEVKKTQKRQRTITQNTAK